MCFQVLKKNYHLSLLLGIVLWDFFTKGTYMGLQSIISTQGLIGQIYSPREILIFSLSLTALMMACLNLGFWHFHGVFRIDPTSKISYFLFIFVSIFILIFGTSHTLGALKTYYRDIHSISG